MAGAFKLDHLQPFEPKLYLNVFKFFTLILGRPILITPEANHGKREILATSKLDETEGFQCLGGSNWTIPPYPPLAATFLTTYFWLHSALESKKTQLSNLFLKKATEIFYIPI